MSSPFENFENNSLNGPYSADRIPELIELVAECVNASSLTEKGKSVRLGQLTNKLLKCNATVWSGLKMVNVSFDRVEIFIDRQDEVLNVVPMIVDAEGDSYDLEEASGKIDFMIPKAEIMRRAKTIRDNQNF
ncbi:MAG: hypothetical protein ACR2NI_04445 [Pirellulales bacterium]